jgi:hypothetical protein
MTFKFIQDIKAEIIALMPDNSVGQITPAIMRGVLQDMTDSLYTRAGALFRSAAGAAAQAITTVPTNYPGIYDTQRQADPAVVATNLVAGTITPAVTGFSCKAEVAITVDGPSGRVVTAVIAKNGVAITQSRVFVTTTGGGDQQSGSIAIPVIGVVAGDVFSVLLSVDVNAAINVWQQTLILSVNPTFSPI